MRSFQRELHLSCITLLDPKALRRRRDRASRLRKMAQQVGASKLLKGTSRSCFYAVSIGALEGALKVQVARSQPGDRAALRFEMRPVLRSEDQRKRLQRRWLRRRLAAVIDI